LLEQEHDGLPVSHLAHRGTSHSVHVTFKFSYKGYSVYSSSYNLNKAPKYVVT